MYNLVLYKCGIVVVSLLFDDIRTVSVLDDITTVILDGITDVLMTSIMFMGSSCRFRRYWEQHSFWTRTLDSAVESTLRLCNSVFSE